MKASKGACVELRIENMAFGGEGVARAEGFVLFVKGGLPGDRVRAVILKKKKAYAEAKILEILEPSSHRVAAPCRHFAYCGGCRWQHAAYERQLEYKKDHVLDALTRIGTLRGTPVHDTIPSEKTFAYRNKMEFSFSPRRWLLPEEFQGKGDDQGLTLGLHVPGTFDKVMEIESCLLQHDTGNQILRLVRKFAKNSDLPAYDLKTHEGFWRFLTLRHSNHFDEWMVNVITTKEHPGVMEALAEDLLRDVGSIRTVVNSISLKKAAVAIGEMEVLFKGDGTIEDRIGPFSFRISANSFFQTNSLTAQRLYAKVAEYAELKGSELVLDLYSGTGTIPIYLSNFTGVDIVGMEINQGAVRDAEMNCRANRVTNCRFVPGDIRETLATTRMKPDVLIIDPPRAGMHKDVLARALELGARKIVYVSCNPPTLARDLSYLAQEYEIVEVQPVDMFPHTFHVEAAAKLVKRNGGGYRKPIDNSGSACINRILSEIR